MKFVTISSKKVNICLLLAIVCSISCAAQAAGGFGSASDNNDEDLKAYSAEIKSIHFVSDHEPTGGIVGKNLIRNETTLFRQVGVNYPQPEWKPASKGVAGQNSPMTHTKNQKVRIKVLVNAKPAGKNFTLVGTDANGNAYLNFTKTAVSTGADQWIENIEAAAPLPNKILSIQEKINWKVIFTDPAIDLEKGMVTSGGADGHRIFVTWGRPLTESYGPNLVTWKRMARLTNIITNAGNVSVESSPGVLNEDATLHNIAKTLQTWISEESGIFNYNRLDRDSGQEVSTIGGSAYWGMIDAAPTGAKYTIYFGATPEEDEIIDDTSWNHGQCAEGARLMAMFCCLLGIPATHKHVVPHETNVVPGNIYASWQADPPQANTDNLIRSSHGAHGDYERLMMWFGTADGSTSAFNGWNWGEGCTLVNGELYSAFTSGNQVGKTNFPAGAINAEHSILMQLDTGELQRWKMNKQLKPDPDEDDPPFKIGGTNPINSWCPGPNRTAPVAYPAAP